MKLISIGIDQSLTRTGLSICKNKKVIKSGSFRLSHLENNTEKRKEFRRRLIQAFEYVRLNQEPQCDKVVVIIERIRLRSQGFLSINYIIEAGALIATIVDIANEYGYPVFSVDTRSWKSKIVGHSKAKYKFVEITIGKNKGKMRKVKDTKSDTLKFVKRMYGIDCEDDDDKADSICISQYAFVPKSQRKLRRET